MKNQSVFDQLKLRVGYGVSGNAMGFGAYDAIGMNAALVNKETKNNELEDIFRQ